MVLFVCLFQFFLSFQISLFFPNFKILFYWITLVSITILSSMILFIFFPSVVFNFNCFSCSVYCFVCCVRFLIQCSHFFYFTEFYMLQCKALQSGKETCGKWCFYVSNFAIFLFLLSVVRI